MRQTADRDRVITMFRLDSSIGSLIIVRGTVYVRQGESVKATITLEEIFTDVDDMK